MLMFKTKCLNYSSGGVINQPGRRSILCTNSVVGDIYGNAHNVDYIKKDKCCAKCMNYKDVRSRHIIY